jgi:hypothetical protein
VEEISTLEQAAEMCQHGKAWQKSAYVSLQDFAGGEAFLCSEAGRYITGCVLPDLFLIEQG